MNHPLPQAWDLETIFAGGSESAEFAAFLLVLDEELAAFKMQVTDCTTPTSVEEARTLEQAVVLMQRIMVKLREAGAYAECLAAANMADKKAVQLSGRIRSLSAVFSSTLTRIDQLLTLVADDVWEQWLASDPVRGIAFPLAERRAHAQEKMAPELEALAGDLAVDGYHGWGSLYDTTVGTIRIDHEENGEVKSLSVGQAFNKLHSSDQAVRQQMFAKWENAWAGHADFCADALNHLAGFRLELYRHRGWNEVLKEPLAINRMSQRTLDAMWNAIIRSKPILVAYLERKAKLLGVERLSWVDVDAPLGSSEHMISYDDGAALIVQQFNLFSPRMAQFSQKAFERAWIEAEDRAGKRPGGFCTSFPVKEETRIFMTYAGTMNNVSTLAHELGHAYHQHLMNDVPALAQEYAMNVAETASTFAELVVSDALVKQATSDQARVALLEDKIQRAVAFFMNIHARFLFETRFYEERKGGLVGTERLNELMEEAQKEAYCDALSEYHPHFWASKLHFYITEVPFYNFPYTFGFLFSAGIYALAENEGERFEERYAALLRDTGSMTVEQLAQKHLGVDLEQPTFWEAAVANVMGDVHKFLDLTK